MQHSLRSRIPAILASLAIALAACPPSSLAADSRGFDDLQPRSVEKVLPPELISGDTWTLGPEAVPVEGLFQFQVSTPWGDFPVYGEAMLRLRVREFRAIAELERTSSTEAGLVGVGRSVTKSFKRLGHAFIHPKRTARTLPQGTRRLYGKLDRYAGKIKKALDKDDQADSPEADADPSSSAEKAAVWLARKYAGVSSKSRKLAREVGVDPFTSNEILAAELERVASAEAIGSVSGKVLMPATLGALGWAADAANIAFIEEWREIYGYNAGLMSAMGVPEEVILDLEVSEVFTPLSQTLMVGMLDAIEGASDRHVVIEQATLLESESEALFFLESIMLAEWYHRERAPLKAFVPGTLIPVAVTTAGNVVAFSAADFFYWTPDAEMLVPEFTDTYADLPGGRTLVCADYVSSRAREGISKLGWEIESGLRQRYDVEIPWGGQDHD